jgi:hypothetical protein
MAILPPHPALMADAAGATQQARQSSEYGSSAPTTVRKRFNFYRRFQLLRSADQYYLYIRIIKKTVTINTIDNFLKNPPLEIIFIMNFSCSLNDRV